MTQNYDMATGTYYPDRQIVPLVLTPVIGYYLKDTGANVANAAAKLIDGHWYRFDNSTDGSFSAKNEISNSDLYSIDTTIGSATYGRLTVKENVMPGNPVTFVFVATLSLTSGYRVTASISLKCDSIELPDIYFDNNTQALYNPWDKSEIGKFTINPVITNGNVNVSYRWQSMINNEWINLGDSPEDYATVRSGIGVTIDRTVMPDQIVLKCIASFKFAENTVEVEKIITHTRRLPAFEYDITHVADIKEDMKVLNPYALILSGKNVIDNPGEEVTISWYGSGTAPIAEGMNPQISISSLGSAMDLGLEVLDAGGYKVLIDDDGAYLADDDGSYFILK